MTFVPTPPPLMRAQGLLHRVRLRPGSRAEPRPHRCFSGTERHPQPLGLDPETVLHVVKHILASGKAVSFDVAEVSPRFDSDNNTAKVAAIFVYALVDSFLYPDLRIQPGT